LYLPASNPRAIAKARSLAADMVILDCEDSVKPEEKAAARTAAVAAAGERFGSCLVAIRVNAAGTEWHLEDLAAARNSAADCIILPKVETGDAAAAAASHLGIPVVAMIETPAGVLNARTIAGTSAALLAGTNDLAASLGIASSAGRTGLACSLQMVVLAARAAGIAVFDGVYNRLDDDEGFATECREGRAFGFDGKSLIHPGQIEIANRIFSPGPDEIAEAERLVAAARGGAERFEGRMIETLHVVEAEAVLAKSRR
jgi:citrate lyase subunit beta/citryl-CoA lyase